MKMISVYIASVKPIQWPQLVMRMVMVEEKMMMLIPRAVMENQWKMTALDSPMKNTSLTLSDQMADRLRDIPMEDWIKSINSNNIHWVKLRLGLILCFSLRAVVSGMIGWVEV